MQTIRLVDSIVVTTSRETHTISKLHPLFSRLEQVFDDELAFYDVLSIEYDTIYQAYDQRNLLIVQTISSDGVSTKYPTIPENQGAPALDPSIATHLGTFITYDELIDYYPEYFI